MKLQRTVPLPLLAAMTLSMAAANASAQGWGQVPTANNPGQIRDAAMAFHAGTGNSVLFGGWPAIADADTWTWTYDGSDWSNA
ncbi:MAG: hypothetical protein AB8H80_15435, partial [Planctomycetota bacterium]